MIPLGSRTKAKSNPYRTPLIFLGARARFAPGLPFGMPLRAPESYAPSLLLSVPGRSPSPPPHSTTP